VVESDASKSLEMDRPTSVQRWLTGSAVPVEAVEDQVEILERFLHHVGLGADELVASLLRPTDIGPRIRLKKRREVMAQIDEWEKEVSSRHDGNVVRAFLVQNGVSLTVSPIW
jgi:hypothetical protein